MSSDPYIVEVDSGGCEHCAQGKSWTVVGPDGVAMGVSYDEESEANFLASMMNLAYETGLLSVAPLKQQCPCGMGAEPWHQSGVCQIGMDTVPQA